MKVKSAISILMISGGLLFSAVGHAGHHAEHFLLSEKAAKKLNLTQAQQDKIATIVEQKKASMKALKMTRHNNKDAFKALIENDYFDEQQARALIAKSSDAKNDLLLAKLRSKQQIWQVLTAEQRAKMEKLKQRKAHRHTK
ncbi:hypothetical protein PA25_26990 [Pseudoalteromonas sp. A25]|uniref:Spy/CpxP family protein refolding chaperone n=1 Tax=Pseudoalteromonas sp. A25 TaxID=116092 RepID=UPI00126106B1|nr:Spy/CpxP family protein refolding chaperone [Pseudoalteromonas sp. A25]BBN82714.1 hypothetical protein PA25_26990 [Pseudoalteromonas sp. A25]